MNRSDIILETVDPNKFRKLLNKMERDSNVGRRIHSRIQFDCYAPEDIIVCLIYRWITTSKGKKIKRDNIGYAVVAWSDINIHILDLWLRKYWRRQGIGTEFMKVIVNHIPDWVSCKTTVPCFVKNMKDVEIGNKTFLHKCGFGWGVLGVLGTTYSCDKTVIKEKLGL